MNRRTFLGAAAAASNLPLPDSVSGAGEGSSSHDIEQQDEFRELEGKLADGWIDLFGEEDDEIDIGVTTFASHEDGRWRTVVALRLRGPHADIGTYLSPEEAVEIAEALRTGANRRFRGDSE